MAADDVAVRRRGVGAGRTGARRAVPWQLNFQPAASPVMAMIESLHDLLLFIITAISVFVLGLLAYACVRYRASRNQVASRRTPTACSRSPGPRSRC